MDAIQRTAPLVHSITNYVTVNDCANALLAIGARPVMSHDPREAAEITRGSQALELNLGATEYLDAMSLSGQAAREKGHRSCGDLRLDLPTRSAPPYAL